MGGGDRAGTREPQGLVRPAGPGVARAVENVVCTFCGCTCDDIALRVEGGRIVEARRACALGDDWFRGQPATDGVAARVEGRPATAEEAIDAVARMLTAARSPLIYGLVEASGEGQAAAVAVADLLGATLDTASSAAHEAWMLAFQRRGKTSATLGEIKNRADCVVLWGVAPESSHPRFFERFVRAAGLYVSGPRTVIAVADAGATASREADRTIPIPVEREFETLWALRAIVRGRRLGSEAEAAIGLPVAELEELAAQLKRCRYGVWVYDAEPPAGRRDPGRAHAILALAEALNEHVPFAALGLRGRGNCVGAESVVASNTGYPFAVNFGRGYPRFGPGEFTAPEVLTRGEADAALIVGCDPTEHLPEAALHALERVPTAVVDFRDSPLARQARAAILTATYGVAAPATVYRMDEMALRARAALESQLPSDADVLGRLADRVRALRPADGRP